jgi:3-oxoacyl-[acyl-carrier-protein] synthase-3
VEENRHNIVTENCFKYAVTNMADASELIMKRNNLTKDVDWLVPHQANKRIIDTASRMNLEESKVLMNIEKYGNYLCNITSSAMILNTYSKKEIQLFCCFWRRFTWGSVYLKWAYDKINLN